MPVSKKQLKKLQTAARIDELKEKIHDKSYIDDAIQRIAIVLSRNLVDGSKAGHI